MILYPSEKPKDGIPKDLVTFATLRGESFSVGEKSYMNYICITSNPARPLILLHDFETLLLMAMIDYRDNFFEQGHGTKSKIDITGAAI